MSSPVSRRGRRAAFAVVALLLASQLGAAAASAASDPSDGGLWYYTQTALEDAHRRTTGEGVTIALVDGPINPSVPDLAGADLTVREPSYCSPEYGAPADPAASAQPIARHATSMASIILGSGAGIDGEPGVRGVAPGATVVSYAVKEPDDGACFAAADGSGGVSAAFHDAVASGADIVSVSGDYVFAEADMLTALRNDVIVVASAGNTGGNVFGLPASFNGAVAVGTLTPTLELDAGSPTGAGVGVVAPGADFRGINEAFDGYTRTTGSSNAAAFTSAALALVMSAYPDATPNQVLQSLARNTDGVDDEPVEADGSGFGAVNIRQMLDVDPTTSADENPFITDDPGAFPSAATIGASAATPEATASPTAESSTPRAPADEESDDSSTLIVWLVVGGAVVVAIVVAVALSRRRGSRSESQTDTAHGPGRSHG